MSGQVDSDHVIILPLICPSLGPPFAPAWIIPSVLFQFCTSNNIEMLPYLEKLMTQIGLAISSCNGQWEVCAFGGEGHFVGKSKFQLTFTN